MPPPKHKPVEAKMIEDYFKPSIKRKAEAEPQERQINDSQQGQATRRDSQEGQANKKDSQQRQATNKDSRLGQANKKDSQQVHATKRGKQSDKDTEGVDIDNEQSASGREAPAASARCPPVRHHVLDANSWVEEGMLPYYLQPSKVQFDALWECHPVERGEVIIFGKRIPTPRWQQPYLRPYKFSGIVHEGQQLPSVLQPYVDWGNTLSCVRPFGRFNGILVNWYQDGTDYMGAHSDDEKELVAGAPILSISLGQERTFRVSSKKHVKQMSQDFRMPGGSYLIMGGGGMQRDYKHAVPKVNGQKGKMMGRRINITFRVFK